VTTMPIRAALHIHSNWSYDGHWELSKVAGLFAARGYRLLLMTEHDLGFSEERRRAHRQACQDASSAQILVIPGIEYSDPSNTVHILVWGDIPFLGAGQETQIVLERVAEQGGVAVLAHPSRRAAWKIFRQEWVRYLAGIEVWNRKTDGWSPSREAQSLVSQSGAIPLVGLDFHSAKQLFPLAVCLNVGGNPDEAKALAALRLGLFSCQAFGISLNRFTGEFGGSTTRVLEAGRRLAARTFRVAVSCSKFIAQPRSQSVHRNSSSIPSPAEDPAASEPGNKY
jgi:hypothetical protein